MVCACIGRVDERDGDYADAYADAQRKRRKVHLLASESTGALSPYFIKLMRSLAKAAKLPEANDTTIYGSARTSPRSFFEHYVSAISGHRAHRLARHRQRVDPSRQRAPRPQLGPARLSVRAPPAYSNNTPRPHHPDVLYSSDDGVCRATLLLREPPAPRTGLPIKTVAS